jgi:nitrogen fixation NifU-like protein
MKSDVDKGIKDGISSDNDYIVEIAKNSPYFGRMNDPTTGTCLKGVCGDEMEFYLLKENDIIREIKFYTQGCTAAMVCGHLTSELALGASIQEALGISPKDVTEKLYRLKEEYRHCSILAVSSLHRAIAGYLLEKMSN